MINRNDSTKKLLDVRSSPSQVQSTILATNQGDIAKILQNIIAPINNNQKSTWNHLRYFRRRTQQTAISSADDTKIQNNLDLLQFLDA